jgi:hypothetical protein
MRLARVLTPVVLSDYHVAYRLVCAAQPGVRRKRAAPFSSLHANIQDVCNEDDVEIISPHCMADPAEGPALPQSKWLPPPALRTDSGGNPA